MSSGHLLFFVAALLAGGGYLWWDVRRHPYARCLRCRGSGKHWSWVQMRHGQCRVCEGSGTRRGFLVWLFRIDPDAHKR